nr:contractile injection system protein, VgrG/Pvc8 family [Anaerocolumna cellulosilytica]
MEYLKVTNCEWKKEVNDYGWASIGGFVIENKLDECKSKISSSEWIALEEIVQGEKTTVISGVVYSFSIKEEIGLHVFKLEIRGEVIKLDIVPHTKIFQNNSNAIRTILSKADSNVKYLINSEFDKAINHMVVQYEETDWSFIKRIVSEVGGYIIPDYKAKGFRLKIGVTNRSVATVDIKEYEIVNNFHRYEKKKNNGVGLSFQGDETEFVFKSRDIYELGDGVLFNGKSLFVYGIHGEFEKQELMNTYTLKYRNGFLQEKKKNYALIGMSLKATVKSVVNDTVTVTFDTVESTGGRAYQYATVYSTTDGAGWFCMPEVGDSVRIYFPSEKAEQSYAISSVHLAMGDKNPDTKFIRNVHGKEISFSEKELKLTNNKGLDIILNDEDGITINSNNSININASDKIDIISSGDKINVEGKEGVELNQGASKIIVKDDVTFVGDQIHIQGLE